MKRLNPKVRKTQVLNAAMTVAVRDTYHAMKRHDVAKAAGCAEGTVNRYFGTMSQLRRAVMRKAVIERCHAVVAQGLMMSDNQAMKASPELRDEVALYMMER